MNTDPISNLIVSLKNAALAGRTVTTVPASELKLAIAEKLKDLGFLKSIIKRGKKVKKSLELELASGSAGESKLKEVKRVSKPSRRVYHGYAEIRAVRQGYGHGIYSTSKGILTDKEARQAKVGGEFLFKIW